MDRRDAYERRIWRLSFMLAGADHHAAAAIAARVIGTRPDLTRLDPAHLDRICVLAARRWTAHHPSSAAPAAAPASPDPLILLRTAARLPRQLLEAWILTRLDQLDPIAVARAMDCSKTAAHRHLDRADELLRPALRDWAAAAGTPANADTESIALTALRTTLDHLDPAPTLRAIRAKRRLHRRIRLALITLTLAILAAAGAIFTITQLR